MRCFGLVPAWQPQDGHRDVAPRDLLHRVIALQGVRSVATTFCVAVFAAINAFPINFLNNRYGLDE